MVAQTNRHNDKRVRSMFPAHKPYFKRQNNTHRAHIVRIC